MLGTGLDSGDTELTKKWCLSIGRHPSTKEHRVVVRWPGVPQSLSFLSSREEFPQPLCAPGADSEREARTLRGQ